MIKKYFFTGLIVVLPAVLTIILFLKGVVLVTAPFEAFFYKPRWFTKALILLFLIASTICVGAIGEFWLSKQLGRIAEKMLHKIPIVNQIYIAAKEVVFTFLEPRGAAFSKVVFVPFPYQGVYSVGLITSQGELAEGEELSVFIPATPNPLMGFLVRVKAEHLIEADLNVHDAIQLVASCGASFSK